MAIELGTIFRIFAIFLGFSLGYLSFRIYKLTQGGSTGFKYLSVAGFMLFLWAGVQIPLVYFLSGLSFMMEFKLITSLLFFGALSFLIPIGYLKLAEHFGIKLSKLYNIRNIWIVYGVILVGGLIYNFMTDYTNLLMELAGISQVLLFMMFFVSSYLAYKLWHETSLNTWLLIFLFTLSVPISLVFGSYTSGCCNEGPQEIMEACTVSLDYANVLPVPCSMGLVKVGELYHILLILGIVFALASFYKMWKSLK